MRFGQNVLRMTWKERFVQFSWKAHCFPVLNWISGQFHDFKNLDAQKCDLAKTGSAWAETSVLYSFHRKRTVFPFWREFEASFTILRTLTLKNAIWTKRAAHDLKRAFCTIFRKSALFSLFGENFRPVWRFWELWRPKCDLAKTCCAWPEKSVLYNFYKKRPVFSFWREFQTSVTILRTFTLKNPVWPKRAAHDMKRAFCTIVMESALLSRFEENFRPVWRFWELSCSKMRFGQNVLRMTWKERFVQFLSKAHGFPFLERISGQCDDFENFDAQNAIWTKRAAHDLKRAFCTIFMQSALLSGFKDNFRPLWRFWEL